MHLKKGTQMTDHSWGNGRFSSSSSGSSMGPLTQNSGWGSGSSWASDDDNIIGWLVIGLILLPFVMVGLIIWGLYKLCEAIYNYYQASQKQKSVSKTTTPVLPTSYVAQPVSYVPPPPPVLVTHYQPPIPVVATKCQTVDRSNFTDEQRRIAEIVDNSRRAIAEHNAAIASYSDDQRIKSVLSQVDSVRLNKATPPVSSSTQQLNHSLQSVQHIPPPPPPPLPVVVSKSPEGSRGSLEYDHQQVEYYLNSGNYDVSIGKKTTSMPIKVYNAILGDAQLLARAPWISQVKTF